MGTGDIPCSRTRDIVTRLRRWCHAVDAESAQDLMDEAATEIERLRSIAKCDNDSPQPFAAAYAVYLNGEYDSSYGPDAIDEALEIAAECNGEVVPLYRTPQAHATPGEGSVPRAYEKSDEKRVLCDTNWEPVAWAILHKDHQYVSLLREHAQAHNVYTDAEIVPLYRSPTLTDEEREAIRFASVVYQQGGREKEAATLRSLLDRLSSGRETPE